VDVNPTEMVDIKVTRQDGVRAPASGFPILVMKSAASPQGDAPVATETTAKDKADEGTNLPDLRDANGAVQVPEGKTPEGVTKTSGPEGPEGDDDVTQKIEKAIAEATKVATERIEALAAEVAVLKATPIPGGPMLTSTAAQRDLRAQSDNLAKAAKYRGMAEQVGFQNRELARFYREKAAELESA
jgi:hypothetical protein